MATITVRNLDESIKQKLRIQAASHNHSMEEEVRIIIQNAVQRTDDTDGIGSRIHKHFMEAGGIELAEPRRADLPRKAEL